MSGNTWVLHRPLCLPDHYDFWVSLPTPYPSNIAFISVHCMSSPYLHVSLRFRDKLYVIFRTLNILFWKKIEKYLYHLIQCFIRILWDVFIFYICNCYAFTFRYHRYQITNWCQKSDRNKLLKTIPDRWKISSLTWFLQRWTFLF